MLLHPSNDVMLGMSKLELISKIHLIQSHVDSLMLKYEPQEMTREQVENWAAHQVPIEFA